MADKQALTIKEIATRMGLSRQTATRLFEAESGVLIIETPETPHKRPYRCIRVPVGVYERVVRRLSV